MYIGTFIIYRQDSRSNTSNFPEMVANFLRKWIRISNLEVGPISGVESRSFEESAGEMSDDVVLSSDARRMDRHVPPEDERFLVFLVFHDARSDGSRLLSDRPNLGLVFELKIEVDAQRLSFTRIRNRKKLSENSRRRAEPLC